MIAVLLLAGLMDPNCIPRRPQPPAASMSKDISLAAAFAYPRHAHFYHAPPRPVCRDPWPSEHLQEISIEDLPRSPVPAPPEEGMDLGHSPVVIWPGYVPNTPRATPHGHPVIEPPSVSVPEPAPAALFVLALGALLVQPAGRSFVRARLQQFRRPRVCTGPRRR